MGNNVNISYLEKMIPTYNERMQQALKGGDRTTMKYYQTLWMEGTKKKNSIEQACGSGAMTIDEYIGIQKAQVEKDTKLLAYFKQTGDQKKAALVNDRLQTTQ